MTAAERRQAIERALAAAPGPLSASELASRFGVSRQIVVGDVALLRAAAVAVSVTDVTQKGRQLLFSFADTLDVKALMTLCAQRRYRSRLLLSAGEHPRLTLYLKDGENALSAAGELVGQLRLLQEADDSGESSESERNGL